MFQSIITTLTLATAATAAVISIDVGNGGLKFAPNSLTANIGDQLVFHFFAGLGAHSVVSSTFENPCNPAPNAFFSGYIAGPSSGGSGGGTGYNFAIAAAAATETIFTVNITSTDPIWFYCSLASHCESGMVGVVNPPAGKTITDFTNAAKLVKAGSAPASVQGGVVATVTVGSSPTPTPSPTLSGNATAATSPVPTTSAKSGAVRAKGYGMSTALLLVGGFVAGFVGLMA